MTDWSFTLDRVPKSFGEGLFWGNGHMGALLYTREGRLHFSVDHTALWETRDTGGESPKKTFRELLADPEPFLDGDPAYVEPLGRSGGVIGRTKLPGLGLELDPGAAVERFRAETDLHDGHSEIRLTLSGGGAFSLGAYLDSCRGVLALRSSEPPAGVTFAGWALDSPELAPLAAWGYAPCSHGRDGAFAHMTQPFSGSGLAVMSVLLERGGEGSARLYLTISVGEAGEEEALRAANRLLLEEYAADPDGHYARHREDWAAFWAASDLSVPSERLQRAYRLEMYKLYCNVREDALPVTLQGVWNPDAVMPAWYGDWHNDLNVQACYWPVYRTGHAALARSYVNYYHACMPRLMERAEKLFGVKDAIHVPLMMGPMGYGAAAEWCFWNMLPGPELFVAVDFSMYYAFTEDADELREKLYPFLRGVLRLYRAIARSGDDGFLHIPFTHSPEVSRGGRMICRDDSTFVISALHCLLGRMTGYAETLGLPAEAEEWAAFARGLVPVTVTENGLPLFPGVEPSESHRHFCHMFPLFPLGTETHNDLAARTLDTVVNMGLTEYASWSLPYLAALAARCGRGNMAAMMEELYAAGFQSRNSFAVNGDPNRTGIFRISPTSAGEPADAFTLEAGFLFASALCDMFVHRALDTVYLAAGIPDGWASASCRGVTVEGGHRLDLEIKDYRIAFAEILPARDEELTFRFYQSDEEPKTIKLAKGRPVRLV